MKTTHTIITTTSKAALLARHLPLLLATVTIDFGPQLVRGADTVPFKGTAQGAIVSATPHPDGVLLTVVADGHATLLGKFSREEVLVLNPLTGTAAGTIVFTAADGDQLFGEVEAQFTSPTTVLGAYTFTGGTGRFANATGGAEAFLSTPDGVHFAVDFDGRVSSVGVDRR